MGKRERDRLLFVGYFEGVDSERGIAWRVADSLALRDFLGVALDDAPPDHLTISRCALNSIREDSTAIFDSCGANLHTPRRILRGQRARSCWKLTSAPRTPRIVPASSRSADEMVKQKSPVAVDL